MSNHARLIAIFDKLISFRTTSENSEQVDACLAYFEQCIDDLGLISSRHVSNGFQSLVISTRNTQHPKVLLQAHIDVVPGYDHQFRLRQSEGKLYGRGVYDMKYAAACFLYLLEDLGRKLPDYDLAVMLTSDEEVDGHNGVEYLLNQGYGADICILPDSGEEWNIEASAKGCTKAEICVRGRSAHGSRPWEGDNAGLKLMNLVHTIDQELAYTSRLGTTVTLTQLSGGAAFNQIPGEATATYDIRFASEETYGVTRKKLELICRKVEAEISFTLQAAAVQHEVDSEYMELWQKATAEVTGRTPTFSHSFAASDARYLVPRGIPTISARPRGGGHHGGEEWLAEKDFYQYYEVVKYFVEHAARRQIDF